MPCAPRLPRCAAVRRHAPTSFARDVATLEEPPECADGDGDAALLQPLPQFRKRNVALGGYGRKDQLGMRLDPVRMAVAALALGPNVALAPFLSPPPDRARRAHAKPLGRRSTRQSALNRVNDTPAKVNGQRSGHARQPPSPARSMNQNQADSGIPHDSIRKENA